MPDNRRTLQRILLVALGAAATLVSGIIYLGNTTSSHASSTLLDEPLPESNKVLGFDRIVNLASFSDKNQITIEAAKDEASFSVVMTNSGQEAAEISTNGWTWSLTGPIDLQVDSEVQGLEKSFVLDAGESTVLHTLSLDDYLPIFEFFPGEYTLELSGWNWKTKDFGNFKKDGNFQDYHIKANVTIAYDLDQISASSNKLIKTKDAGITWEGDGTNAFEVTDSAPRMISFHIVNNGQEKTSSVQSWSQFEIWRSDKRFPSIGTTSSASGHVIECTALEPGESKMVGTYEFSKSKWPIAGENGLSEAPGGDGVIPGIYVIHYTYSTQPCNLDSGEELPTSTHSVITVLEVK